MRKVLKRQQRAAWLLLMLYVPLLLAISTHIHTEVADDIACEECLHHVCHESHFSQDSFTWDDCVLCQLNSAPCVVPSTLSLTTYSNDSHTTPTMAVAIPPTSIVSLHSPRAPPYSF